MNQDEFRGRSVSPRKIWVRRCTISLVCLHRKLRAPAKSKEFSKFQVVIKLD